MERQLEQDRIFDLLTKWMDMWKQMLRNHEVQLALLDRAWGQWSWSETGQGIVCRDTATVQAYNRTTEEMRQLIAEHASLEQQIGALRKR
jgi:hypothetical protein